MTSSAVAGSSRKFASILGTLRICALPILLFGALMLALFYGSVSVPPTQIVAILLHRVGLYGGTVSWAPSLEIIIWDIRLPEVLAAALVGAALAVAGTLFQAVLRNPLADPYVIGTSAGAQLGVTLAYLSPFTFSLVGFGPANIGAFLGAVAAVLLVYSLARTAGRTPVVTLILAGFVLSSFLISLTTFVTYAGDRVGSRLTDLLNWTLGGVQVQEWSQLALAGPCILGSTVAALLLGHRLNLILLGEAQAGHLGVRVERLKLASIVLASFLTALAVTLAGVVAFVGLVVPHAMRLLYGPDHRILVPAAAFAGATFVVLCDLAARTVISPSTMPLGVVTAILGAPLFLHLLRRSRRDYGV